MPIPDFIWNILWVGWGNYCLFSKDDNEGKGSNAGQTQKSSGFQFPETRNFSSFPLFITEKTAALTISDGPVTR